tara:strand:- start:203 stop:457 length:255 start_codon:yes stop_codon:yes gene_type:complete
MTTEERWLKTSDAAYWLGVSQWYLKQCRDCYEDGFLIEREHYILGASRTAPIKWNVNAVLDAFHERGKIIQEGRKLVQQLREEK